MNKVLPLMCNLKGEDTSFAEGSFSMALFDPVFVAMAWLSAGETRPGIAMSYGITAAVAGCARVAARQYVKKD